MNGGIYCGLIRLDAELVIEQISPVSWIPSELFALFSRLFPAQGYPISNRADFGEVAGGEASDSRIGYAVWAVTFMMIAAILAYHQQPPSILVILLMVCILAIVGVGVRDTLICRRSLFCPPERLDR